MRLSCDANVHYAAFFVDDKCTKVKKNRRGYYEYVAKPFGNCEEDYLRDISYKLVPKKK